MRKNEKSRRSDKITNPNRWQTYAVILACSLLLLAGFFFAGRQHFSSMDYGMKNSKLRKQVDELEAEKRRLMLAREISMSPSEIKKSAKKVGIYQTGNERQSAQLVSLRTEKLKQSTDQPAKSMVVRTSAISPSRKALPTAYLKLESSSRESRATLQSE